jgi:hypothetical protein
MAAVPDSLDGIIKEVPTSVRELEKLPMYLMLIVLGGGIAVLLGVVFGIIEIAMSVALLKWVGEGTVHLIVCLVMGALLIFSFVICKRDLFTGSILAGISGLVLIIAGGIAGLIGGLFGVLGAFLAFIKYSEQHVLIPPLQPVQPAQPAPAQPPQPEIKQEQKPDEKSNEKPAEKPADRPVEKSAETPAQGTAQAAESIFCMHCGTKVPANSGFCNSCGGKLE